MIFLLLACQSAPASLEVQTFETVYSRISQTCPDPGFYGTDWEAAHDELLPAARKADSPEALRPVLEDFVSRLGVSHYRILASVEELPSLPGIPGDSGLQFRRIDGQVLVTSVSRPAEKAGIGLGWSLRKVGDQTVEQILGTVDRHPAKDRPGWLVAALQQAMGQPEGSSLSFHFEDGSGNERAVSLVLGPPPGPVSQVGFGVPVQMSVQHRSLTPEIGLIAFNAFYAPLSEEFAAAMEGFLKLPIRGLILDLRGNEGGVVGMTRGLGGWLFAEPTSLGTLHYREQVVDLKISPRAETFAGPVAVLVDTLTASSAEIFAAGLKGRARIFGERTAGDALPSAFERLPDGDVLQMAVADYRHPTGIKIEGEGVKPDEEVFLSREALLSGVDPVLAAAQHWLESQ